MEIIYQEKKKRFHLRNDSISYIFQVEKDKYLQHCYFGPALTSYHQSNPPQFIDRGFNTNPISSERTFSLNTLPLETSTQGSLDYRIANYQFLNQAGNNVTAFEYESYRIYDGKPKLSELPTLRGSKAKTLEIVLIDSIQQLKMILHYSIFTDSSAITRSVTFENLSNTAIYLENAGSLMLDLPRCDYDLVTLNGAHTNEANITRQKLHPGIQRIDSNRGTSSPQHQPFLALANWNTTENSGEVMAFHLIYSGNFIAQVEVEQYGTSRVQMGINPDTFSWKLDSKAIFETPEAVMVYSTTGFNGMSQTFHHLYQEHLVPKTWQKKERPILLNTWEGNYFDFTETDLLNQADKAKELGIELFVLDDGWFGQRNDDTKALGDWFENTTKIPSKITGLAEKIHEKGLQFGLWFEPEMISKESLLFNKHPEWALQVPNYPLTQGRQQLVLDFSKEAVQDFIIDMLTGYLQTGKIDYIKWDMNRHLTEVGNLTLPQDQQQEIAHRYVLGLYRILQTLTTKFPEVLFENCSSGGGRFDPGMMAYMPQTWTSDNSDALCRTRIQSGYSYLYPPIMMGAHVSDVPNHQVGRITPLKTRGLIAMSGNFGYELAINQQSETTLTEIKKQINFYKKHRQLLQFGDFYRLLLPTETAACAWLFKNKDEALVVYFHGLAQPAQKANYLKTYYLDHDALYQEVNSQAIFSGAELNHAGLLIPRIKGDFETCYFHFKKITSTKTV
ncbi:alpha-galactosidase [Enterococcus sp. DIV0755b]|uniref:alpha-galactosidase n=1 Tax=Enterococcus sp. DIV0755b TaxID=2774657 RepID=UPI003F214702